MSSEQAFDGGGVAPDQLKSYVERIERLEEDKQSIADDIGRSCPICGTSLLTEADYRVFRELERAVDAIGRFAMETHRDLTVASVSDDTAVVSVSVAHHDGTTTITVPSD